jgi:hypothetical protein
LSDLILVIVNGQNVFSKDSHLRYGFGFERQPEFFDLLVAPHKFHAFDLNRWFFGGMARNLEDRKNDDRFAWDKLPSNIGQFGKKMAWGCLGIPAPIATGLPVCFTAS